MPCKSRRGSIGLRLNVGQGQWKFFRKKREKNLGSRTPFSIWKSSIALRGSVQLVSASLKKVSVEEDFKLINIYLRYSLPGIPISSRPNPPPEPAMALSPVLPL